MHLSQSKGYVYTLEAMIAIALIFVTLIFVFSSSPEQPETSLAIMKQNVYDALVYLDQSDDLRNATSTGSVSAIESNLSKLLPASIKYDTIVCTTSCNSSELPANRTIVTVDYYISGYQDKYVGRKVRIWIWRRF